jgi:molybdate transport system substrate-binding protein
MALAAAAPPSLAQSLVVATDSSFGDAMNAVARDFEAGHKGLHVRIQRGAVGALLEQIGKGEATVDVLAGADVQTVELGEQRRLLRSDPRCVFATNTLVLVVSASLKVPVQQLSDLARPDMERIAMARQTTVPAGRYAREAINAQRL